jgi:hypothetical protein
MSGPVISAAKVALEKGDITPVVFWFKSEYENELRAAFKKTLEVRKLSPTAKEFADMYFFETLVRLHRTGEGAPYTGIVSGAEINPAVEMADLAINTGSIDKLLPEITSAISQGIKEKFQRVLETKAHI